MKIHKSLIGCSILMTISLIVGCSTKSDTNIEDLIETTVISDEELNKNGRDVTEALPDNSTANINEQLQGNDEPNMSGQQNLDIMAEVIAIDDATLTVSMIEVIDTIPSASAVEDSKPNYADTTTPEQTLTVTNETFINIQNESETIIASFLDIKVGDIIKYNYKLYENGEQILTNITIMNTTRS